MKHVRQQRLPLLLSVALLMGWSCHGVSSKDVNEPSKRGNGTDTIDAHGVEEIRGLLVFDPLTTKSFAAWDAQHFKIDDVVLRPTDEIPFDTLRKHAGQRVVIRGVMDPGQPFDPSEHPDREAPVPLDDLFTGETEVIMRGSGIRVLEIRLDDKGGSPNMPMQTDRPSARR